MISLLLSAIVRIAAPDTGGTLVGTVHDAESGRPLSGATVVAIDAGRRATTGSDGRYVLSRLPAGPQRIVVRSVGHAPYDFHAVLPRQGTLELNVSLDPLPTRLPIVQVRRFREGADHSSGAAGRGAGRSVSAASLTLHPQLAEPDFLRAIAGGDVVVAAETPGGLHVRGGSTDQTGYTVDGIPVFNPYHASDLIGGWNTDAFRGARLTSDADGTSALSGTLHLTSREPGPEVSSRGGVSTTHARLTADGPLGIGRASGLVSARAAWPAGLAPNDDPTFIRGRSGDWFAKVATPVRGGSLRGFIARSIDGVNLAPVPPDVSLAGSRVRRNTFDWSSSTAALQWQGGRRQDSLTVAGWRSSTTAGGTWGSEQSSVLASRRADYGVQARVSRRDTLQFLSAGLRLEESRMDYQVAQVPATPLRLRSVGQLATVFGDIERGFGTALSAGAGATMVRFSGRTYFSPQLRSRWAPTGHFAVSATMARSHQFVQSLRNPESAVGFVFPAELSAGASRGVLPVARGDEVTVAADLMPAPGLSARLFAYARATRGVVLVAPVDDAPFLRGPPLAGSATARGAYAEARVTAPRYLVLARYGLQDVRYRHSGGSYVPGFGARALLDGGVTLFPGPTTTVRLGVHAASGRRVTPATGTIEWESCNLKDRGCEFAGSPRADPTLTGTMRAPDYVRIDLGLRKQGHLRFGGRTAEVAVFGTYSNLLKRFNVLTYGLVNGVPEALEMRPQAPLVVGLDWRY